MMRAQRTGVAAALACVLGIGCSPRADKALEATERPPASSSAPAPPPSRAADRRPKIVVLGDSLTAGLGLNPDEAYPALLQQRVDAAGLSYSVINAGVSGDTSAGGLSRLDWALEGNVRLLIVALGGNDGLRGLPAPELKKNLATIVERAQGKHVTVILAGMEAPPNFGQDYIVSFRQVYSELAAQYHVAIVPFLLEGVAGDEALNQRDGIHPTAEGARIVAGNVWRVLEPILEKGRATR